MNNTFSEFKFQLDDPVSHTVAKYDFGVAVIVSRELHQFTDSGIVITERMYKLCCQDAEFFLRQECELKLAYNAND
jgi:hypothetical protein